MLIFVYCQVTILLAAITLVSRHLPSVQWAQRKDKLYITINVEDCKKPIIKIEPNSLYFELVTAPVFLLL